MHHFQASLFAGVRSNPPGESPSGELTHAAISSFTATASNSRVVRWIIIFGVALIAAIIAATGLMLQNLRDRELAESERELKSLTFVLAEQIDRSFQSMELIQTAVIERMRTLGIASAEDYKQQMSGRDTYQRLKDQISGLPHVDALVLLDSEGNRINVSRAWPNTSFKASEKDLDFLEAFNSDPFLTAFVGSPIRNPITGTWVINFVRRFTGSNGVYLGAVLGVVTVQSFEQTFETIAPTPNSSITLARRDGMLLARWPRQEAALGQSSPYREMFENLLSRTNHATVRRNGVFDGQDRLFSAHSLAHYPIVVVATTPVEDAVAHWRNGVIYVISTGALLAFVVGGLVFLSALQVGRRLRGQNKQFDAALNNMTQGLNMFDTAARLAVCNVRYLQMYRLSPGNIKPGCTIRDIVEQRIAAGTFFSVDPEKYIADLTSSIAKNNPTSATMELTDGRVITVISQPIADGSGWVVTHEDITERRCAEKERDRSQELANTVIENVPVTIVVKDARDLRVVLINRAGADFYGVPRENIIGKTVHDIFPSTAADHITEQDKELLRSGDRKYFDEHPIAMPGNKTSIVTSTKLSIRDQNGEPQYLLTVIEDRTQRKRDQARIAHMAHHDELTGLPNRAAFNECLETTLAQAVSTGESFAVLCVDLDRFKEVNDVFGHIVGDALLRQIASRLQGACEGAFLARVGGDEFTVITAVGPQPATAETISERISGALAKEIEIDGHQLRAVLTTGVSIYPNDGADAESLVANADAALYRAKAEDRGSIRFFEPDMDKRLREKRVLQQDLRSAIACKELELYYQPQALIGGEITGFEALLRWHHPTRGMVSPGTFIPLAEESGLIISLGEWVLRETCREAASWPRPLSIAINLSPMQFRHGDLPALVHEVLLETGLTPSRLELEITEGVLVDDFARAVSHLRRLKNLGVRIAMDDFGTGYSSLSYLQSFPFDKIKIDQSFISKLSQNSQSKTIIRAVIGLGRGLDLPVIAEGVETEEQLAFLSKEGCNEMQGFLIGRPKPIRDYGELVGREKIHSASVALAS
jgi:diguanylate cyclase (GGDEF)-like protein/PAS domain S-box-containing protein